MNIKQNQEFFESIREQLTKTHNGMFAVVKDCHLLGCYPSIMEAYIAGSNAYLAPFMIQVILRMSQKVPAWITLQAKCYADCFKNQMDHL